MPFAKICFAKIPHFVGKPHYAQYYLCMFQNQLNRRSRIRDYKEVEVTQLFLHMTRISWRVQEQHRHTHYTWSLTGAWWWTSAQCSKIRKKSANSKVFAISKMAKKSFFAQEKSLKLPKSCFFSVRKLHFW